MARALTENVGVHYHFGSAYKHAREPIQPALSRISIELKDGDRLGLIGDNGAGKTTLLKVLSGVLPPTTGIVHTQGKVSALMAIQVGMFPNFTGHQNIISRCRFMGYSEKEIALRLEDIVEFTELGGKLNEPLRTYSAGMRLRLAFAVATAFSPEILIMDEWLSAGDAKFQKKARSRLQELVNKSGIFAFASHSEVLQKQMCNKGLVLRKGEVQFLGSVNDAWDFAKNND